MDNLKKIKRMAQVATVLSKYGFETLITQTDIKKLIPNSYITNTEKRKEAFALSTYERIRMVLEELGPAYIKLGQLLSNRDDLLPEELIVELKKLQDDVSYNNIDISSTIKEELSVQPEEIFEEINSKPIAAASLSQVYSAVLKDGHKKVIIKVKRKGIRGIIEADILIMKDFAGVLEKYYEAARKIGLYNIICTFEKSILSELSFSHELANIERFRSKFKGNDSIYVPQTYKALSNGNILCMEFIDGIKISDKERILESGLDPKTVASTVVDLYLKQIVDYGFFHADPHSGNIFVLSTGQIVFIDYGSVGKMSSRDKENLGDFVIYALRKDVKRLVKVIKKVAVKYTITDESLLGRNLYEFLEIMDETSIKELDLKDMMHKIAGLLNENQIILPDHIYLLVRGIVLLEGIGHELGLETSIIENIKPYGAKLAKQRLNPKYISNKVLDKLYNLGDRLEELPEDVHSLIQKVNNDELKITHSINGLADIKNTINRLVIAMIISSITIGSSILILSGMPPKAWGVSIIGAIGLIFSGILTVILILIILRNKKVG